MEERRISGVSGLDSLQLWGNEAVVSVPGASLWPTSVGPLRRRHLRVSPLPSARLSKPERTGARQAYDPRPGDPHELRRLSESWGVIPCQTQRDALANI